MRYYAVSQLQLAVVLLEALAARRPGQPDVAALRAKALERRKAFGRAAKVLGAVDAGALGDRARAARLLYKRASLQRRAGVRNVTKCYEDESS